MVRKMRICQLCKQHMNAAAGWIDENVVSRLMKFRKFVKSIPKRWHSLTKRNKFAKWIDNYILYYVWQVPYDTYKSIRTWLYCNTNKYHWRLVSRAYHAYPWDFGYLLDIEYAQLDKMMYWFTHHQLMCDEQYEHILKYLGLAKRLLGIIINETDLYHYDGKCEFVPGKHGEDGEWIDLPKGTDAELYRFDKGTSKYVYDGPDFNMKNCSRFMGEKCFKRAMERGYLHEMYIAKCKHLYYYIRERYTVEWWD